ncbi:MAG: hypothetical protein OCD02_01785 [Spirochaetaceae bacterium]
MLKKAILILILPLYISCNKGTDPLIDYNTNIKNIIINSEKIGTTIKLDIATESGIFLSYPEHVVESYSLIKFLSSLLKKYGDVTVFLPQYPKGVTSESLIDILRVEAPLLATKEILELSLYLEKVDIELTGTLSKTDGKVIILAPEEHYNDLKKQVLNHFPANDLIYMIMVGTEITSEVKPIIKLLPEGKKISSIPINVTKFSSKLDDFDILVLMDETDKYNLVTPIELYNQGNYHLAPVGFLDNNDSIFESLTIKKLNNALPKRIKKYGEKL